MYINILFPVLNKFFGNGLDGGSNRLGGCIGSAATGIGKSQDVPDVCL